MLPALVTLVLFLAWSTIGIAASALLRADLRDMRVALTAPVFGSAIVLLPLFTLSNFGVPMRLGGPPVLGGLLVASVIVLFLRRPHLPLGVLPVLALCIVGFVLVGRPMFEFGFHWLANANGDMGYYVLSATELINHGLRTPIDAHALAQSRDFPTWAQQLNLGGLRPGTQITLGAVAAAWNRSAVDLYMPLLLATNTCVICAVGGLTMQATRRWWGAAVAAALIVASPLWAYGVVQQLLPQVWGVGLAVALFAWLMRPEIHRKLVPVSPDLVVIVALAASLFIVYFELAASLLAAYLLYVVILATKRQVSVTALALLWGAPILITVLITNAWLPRAIDYLHAVVAFGTGSGAKGTPIFGYAVVPTALVGVAGLRQIYAQPGDAHMSLAIGVAALLLLGALVVCVITAMRRVAAGVVVLGDLVVGVLLASHDNQFGLFKLYMYAQPFVAAMIAVWLVSLRSRRLLLALATALLVVVGVQLATLTTYVDKSFNPVDLPHASAADVLPEFSQTMNDATKPVVTATDNFALIELQAAVADKRTIYFLSRNMFARSWRKRTILVPSPGHFVALRFQENQAASSVLSSRNCLIFFPTGSEVAINRRMLPEGSANFEVISCRSKLNRLVFINSSLGQPSTLPLNRRAVSFWQLEPDAVFPGRTFSGFGRYALFQILGPVPARIRVALDVTTTPILSSLPRAAVAGRDLAAFPLAGSGSARVISPPVEPVLVDGRAYIVLDMGRKGKLRTVPRPGLTGLWGRSVVVDPRALTSYIRDVSLVPAEAYRSLRTPTAIRRFPSDLSDPDLEYSGIYEDGWLSGDAYAILPAGRSRLLSVRGNALPLPHQRVELLVNGKPLADRAVGGGVFDWQVRVPPSAHRRRVELRWATTGPIAAEDPRRAAARLSFLGFAPTPAALRHFPADLQTGVAYSGIYDDGWLARVAHATLSGGRAGHLIIRADVPESRGQRLLIRIDGRQVASTEAARGTLDLRVPIAASATPRAVELVWARTEQLAPPDTRHAAARLELLKVG